MESQAEAAAIIHGVQQLFGKASMGAEGRVIQIQRRKIDVQLRGDVIARAEVDLAGGVDEGRLDPEHGIVLLLTEMIEIPIAPVGRDARLETGLFIEANQVGELARPVTAKPLTVRSNGL